MTLPLCRATTDARGMLKTQRDAERVTVTERNMLTAAGKTSPSKYNVKDAGGDRAGAGSGCRYRINPMSVQLKERKNNMSSITVASACE